MISLNDEIYYETKCYKCNCLFNYNTDDIQYSNHINSYGYFDEYIICPSCNTPNKHFSSNIKIQPQNKENNFKKQKFNFQEKYYNNIDIRNTYTDPVIWGIIYGGWVDNGYC